MKKKLFALCLAAAFVLTACGAKTEEPVATVEAVEETTEEAAEAPVETEVAEEVETEVVTEEETEAATEETVTEEAEFAKGILTENGWESEWLGMRFVPADGMVMSTEEELDELMGLSLEELSEDFGELQLTYAELNTVIEMQCIGADQITNVSMNVEKLPMELDIDTYQKLFMETMSNVSGVSWNVLSDGEDVIIGEREFRKLPCEVDYEGMTIYQDYYMSIEGKRAVSMVVTYIDEEACEDLMSCFQAY